MEFHGRLFGIAGQPAGRQQLVTSSDGSTWVRVNLGLDSAGSPDDGLTFSLSGPVARAGVLTLTARGLGHVDMAGGPGMDAPIGVLRVWTSTDARRWQEGPPIVDPEPFVSPDVTAADGVLLLGASSGDGVFHLLRKAGDAPWQEITTPLPVVTTASAQLGSVWAEGDGITGLVGYLNKIGGGVVPPPVRIRSTDRGRTWTVDPCPDNSSSPCWIGVTPALGLLLWGDRTSTDDGATWTKVAVRPPLNRDCSNMLIRAPMRVKGGWIAIGSVQFAGGPTEERMLRSTDGVAWTATTGESCPASKAGHTYTAPIRFDGQLWTVRTGAGETPPNQSDLLASGDDGATWTVQSAPRLGERTVSGPVIDDDQIFVPVYDDRSQLAELRGISG